MSEMLNSPETGYDGLKRAVEERERKECDEKREKARVRMGRERKWGEGGAGRGREGTTPPSFQAVSICFGVSEHEKTSDPPPTLQGRQ